MILDTNALSALADGDPGIRPILENADELSIPVIVLGEYRYGIGQSRKRAGYESWLSGLIADCQVIVVDDSTAERYAEIRAELKQSGCPIPANDLWIAALVRQHKLPLLSRDKHFDCVPDLVRVSW